MNKSTWMENNTDQSRGRKVFVGGLSAELTEDEFKSYFEKFGRITDVVVMHDGVTNRPRGFGFITFDSLESVDSVLQNNFHELIGRRVEVKIAIPKKGNYNGGRVSNPIYIPNGRASGGKSPFANGNVPLPNPYYGSYTFYPGFTHFPPYGGLVDLYGSNLYGNWFSPFGRVPPGYVPNLVPPAYGPNFFGVGMFPPSYKNPQMYPTYSSKGLSNTMAAGNKNGNVEIKKQTTYVKRNMSADAVPFQIKDRA